VDGLLEPCRPASYWVDLAIASGQFLVVVRSGTVLSSEGYGIHLTGDSSEVDQVRVLACGGNGITVGRAGRVSRSFSGGNRFTGISVRDGGLAENNESRGNGGYGIFVGVNRLSSSVIGNRVFDNLSGGINAVTNEILISRNVVSDNASFQISPIGRFLGDNLCTNAFC
jgi:hypothetical protein